MVVQDKKTGEIRICVDLRKLNDACLHDPFPTPFTDKVLDNVRGQEVYSFIDGFLGYHQIWISKEYHHKNTFRTEWGSYQYIVMSFGLKNSPTIFSRVVVEVVKEFLHKFLEAYFDDSTIFSLLKKHIECPRIMLDKCRQCQISLNLKKYILFSPFGVLLGHIVCKKGLLVDPSKIAIIVDIPPPTSVKQMRKMTMKTPFKLVYGLEVVVPMEYLVPRLRISTFIDMDDLDVVQERLAQLVELEEDSFIAGFHQQVQKEREKAYHDRNIKKKEFKKGNLVLLYDSKFIKHPGKFRTH
jgi:hypothetical protein